MRYSSIDDLLKRGSGALAKGPLALVFAEDDVEIDATLRHNLQLGFKPRRRLVRCDECHAEGDPPY